MLEAQTPPSCWQCPKPNAHELHDLLPSAYNLGDGMPYDCAGLLCLLLCQTARHAHLQCRCWLPARIAGVESKAEWERLESCDEDAVCEGLL